MCCGGGSSYQQLADLVGFLVDYGDAVNLSEFVSYMDQAWREAGRINQY